MENPVNPHCASCPYDWSERFCRKEKGKAPEDCPSLRHRDLVNEAAEKMKDPETLEFARQASIQEAEGYGFKERGYGQVRPVKPRLVEVMEFAKRMHFERIALVFCVGLRREAAVVEEIFKKHGLHVLSIVCKVGRVSKEFLQLTRDQQISRDSFESMCNPVLQALIANRCRSQFNVLLGLCVGHDSLFFQNSEAPCTVLAVKDRLLGHNPLAAVFQYESYYRYLKHPAD
ncbi:MAG: DUF1847 domain-containing protein [Deltaproteobacteria bacterium]|nr:DUF1847 domain-containing protein [Deltaproteobacteria bacterium]